MLVAQCEADLAWTAQTHLTSFSGAIKFHSCKLQTIASKAAVRQNYFAFTYTTMLTFLHLFTVLLVAATTVEGHCPFIQAMADDTADIGAESLYSPHGDHFRKLQPADATFFVDWSGTGNGTTYDLDNSRPSNVYNSRATVISNVPTGYTTNVFKSHRSSSVLTYKLYGYEVLSMNKLSLGFAETHAKSCAIGQRVMAVTVNGVGVATGLDVFANVGCNAALIVTSEIPANKNGTYEI